MNFIDPENPPEPKYVNMLVSAASAVIRVSKCWLGCSWHPGSCLVVEWRMKP
jgi:hypothetical protein